MMWAVVKFFHDARRSHRQTVAYAHKAPRIVCVTLQIRLLGSLALPPH
jgi:hypothetical protein